ncbi:transposase, partial [Streptomyces sp. NBS 14/10]
MRIRDELGVLFQDADFAAAFPVRGGPGLAPGMLAVVSVMQFAERLTDRQAADAVRSRIDWKYLLGLELEDEGFHFSVLSGFRTRLIEHSHEQVVLDRLLTRLSGLGFLRAGGRVRTDATHVLAPVRDVNRLEFCTATPAPGASTSSGHSRPQATARPGPTRASRPPTSRSTGTRSAPSAPKEPRAATGAAPAWTASHGPWSTSPNGTAATARSAPRAPA